MIEAWKAGHVHEEIFNAEELANSISHGVGLGMSIAGVALLMVIAVLYGDTAHIVSASVYGFTLILLFAASTIYHAVTPPRLRHAFRILDHSAIYLLIAGTYTPFTLVTLAGGWGWTLFGIVWTLALVGVIYKVFFFGTFRGLSLALYLAMGWTIVIAIKPLLESMELGGVILLFTGGFFYTSGVVFYVWEKLFFNHAIWHLFVLGGAVSHYFCILFFVML